MEYPRIGNIQLDGFALLAPMAGVSDLAYRVIARKMGAALTTAEMVSAKGLYYHNEKTKDMLKIAEKRAASAKQKIDFIEGNMLDLSKVGQYDFVTCYSDSICYMQDEVEVGDVFKEVYNVLNENGVFIFDVHSTYQTDEVFPGYSYHENAEDFAMLWDTYEDAAPHSIVHELTFFVKEADGSFSRHDEVHEERTYEVLTYDILLEQAGFKSFKLYADFEDKEPTETSTRWFFVAQK